MTVSIAYNNAALLYAGRWVDSGTYYQAYWQGSQIRFAVTGTTNLRVYFDAAGSPNFISANIDGGDSQIFNAPSTGSVFVDIPMPDTGRHTVVLRAASLPSTQWTGSSYTRITSYELDGGGAVEPYANDGTYLIGTIGDSWMASSNDWPQYMDPAIFNTYPISFGGAKASDLNTQYPFVKSGGPAASDPAFDVVIIGAGVNDYNAGVSLASFKSSMGALIDKVRADHPTIPIGLLQSPRNVGAGRNYDQYGPALSELAVEKTNVHAILIGPTEWNTYSWADSAHLDYASKVLYAAYVQQETLDIIPAPVIPPDTLYVQTPRGRASVALTPAPGPVPQNSVLVPTDRGDFYLQLQTPTGGQDEIKMRTPRGVFSLGFTLE